MTIITLLELKKYLGSKSTEFTDGELEMIIQEVNLEIQQELNVDIFREQVKYIDETRTNYINGENKIFYFKNYIDKYLADKDGDGSVTISDVIIYSVDTSGVETLPIISSINHNDVSIELLEAPDNKRLFATYSYSFYDMSTPDNRIKTLAKYLALAYCYFELELDLVGTSIKMGNISYSGINTNSKTAKFTKKYETLLKKLKVYGTSKNKPTKFNITKFDNYRPSKEYGYKNYNNTSYGGF